MFPLRAGPAAAPAPVPKPRCSAPLLLPHRAFLKGQGPSGLIPSCHRQYWCLSHVSYVPFHFTIRTLIFIKGAMCAAEIFCFSASYTAGHVTVPSQCPDMSPGWVSLIENKKAEPLWEKASHPFPFFPPGTPVPSHFIPMFSGRNRFHPHFTDEETDIQISELTFSSLWDSDN